VDYCTWACDLGYHIGQYLCLMREQLPVYYLHYNTCPRFLVSVDYPHEVKAGCWLLRRL